MEIPFFACVMVLAAASGCGGAAFSSVGAPASDAGGSSPDAAAPNDGSIAATDGNDDGGGGATADTGTTGDTGAAPDSGGAGDTGGSGSGGTTCGPTLACTGTGGQQGTVCCVGAGAPPQFGCAASACGCETQLQCSSSTDCGGATPVCCIRQQQDASCSGGVRFAAACASDCQGGFELCDPQAPSCTTGSCQADVSCVGLPVQQGWGVCGGC